MSKKPNEKRESKLLEKMYPTSPSGSFLENELDELWKSDQPVDGDILFFDGSGATSSASKLAQRFARPRAKVKYSHVGIIVEPGLYMDAVSREGVRVRKISDLKTGNSGYVVNRCEVARNKGIILNEKPVWVTAFEYYKLPYKLRSILKNGTADEDEAVICSKFVAMVLRDIGFKVGSAVQRTFPCDLDVYCGGNDWRRFPLCQYDLFSNPASVPTQREQYTQQWLDRIEPLHNINVSQRKIKRSAAELRKIAKSFPVYQRKSKGHK